uniref:Uncharacterized protein n=1 Tax=Pakpunavirus sp. TaxID=2833053 RepID=A0AB39BZQ1_9CAUD
MRMPDGGDGGVEGVPIRMEESSWPAPHVNVAVSG